MNQQEGIRLILGLIGSYLLGSIPASFLIAKYGFGVDLRTVGSGNVGATNALRAIGPKAGVPALIMDALKGTLAVVLAPQVLPGGGAMGLLAFQLTCGVAAVLGHSFTIFLGFKGGKGVATGAGVFLAVAPKPLGLSFAVFMVTVAATRYVSLGSVLAALSLPLWIWFLAPEGKLLLLGIAVPMAGFILYRHRSNLSRLMAGTESKLTIGRQSASPTPPKE